MAYVQLVQVPLLRLRVWPWRTCSWCRYPAVALWLGVRVRVRARARAMAYVQLVQVPLLRLRLRARGWG